MMTGVSLSPLGSGGAVFCTVICTIIRSQFFNNHADQSGGAVCSLRSLTVDSTLFVNASAGFFGGVGSVMQVALSPGPLVVSNCTVLGAYAALDGGAFYSENAVSVSSSLFEDTSSGRTGGAICGRSTKNQTGSDVLVLGSTFRRASSVEAGGAVFANGPVTKIVDCTFENVSSQQVWKSVRSPFALDAVARCYADRCPHPPLQLAGAVYGPGTVIVESSQFVNVTSEVVRTATCFALACPIMFSRCRVGFPGVAKSEG